MNRKLKLLVMCRMLPIIFLALICVSYQSPFQNHVSLHKPKKSNSLEGLSYRLPDDVIPFHYTLNLTLEEDAFTTNTFSGISSIDITTTKRTNVVVFHAKDMTIQNVVIRNGDQILETAWSGIDLVTDLVRAETKTELTPEPVYTLIVSYTAILSEKVLNGFYKGSYVYNGTTHYVASTQFQATDARKAFPCFDEPALKATFDVTIAFPQGYNALGNTPIVAESDVPRTNLHQVTFATTPKMSTYLVAFVVSEFDCSEAKIETEVCSRADVSNMRNLALNTAVDILRIMKEYTNYDYFSSGIGKLTQVSVPAFSAGGMENWGLAIYRDEYLLLEDESTVSQQRSVVTIVAHELAHQWFGDLVTLNWWSDVFLNEGFATFFMFYAPDEIYPEWELPKFFATQYLPTTFNQDSYLEWSNPLSYPAETPAQIDGRFDFLSYYKGGTIVAMVRYFLGLDNFKSGLVDYFADNKFATTTPTVLWETFEQYAQTLPEPQKPPAPMLEIMANWTYQAGFPLVTVTSDGDDVKFSQKRFLSTGTSDTRWYIPLTYSLENDVTSDTVTRAWLTPAQDLVLTGILANSSYIVVNNQQIGYYRVDYDDQLWRAVSQALFKPGFSGIDVVNRAQIVDDLFTFAKVGMKNYTTVLDLLSFLETEDEYYPWNAAFRGFSYLLERVGDQTVRAPLMAFISNLMEKLYTSVSFAEESDDHIYNLKQNLTLHWACFLNNQNCVDKSRRAFVDFRDNFISPSRDLRNLVYCNGLRHSDSPVRDFGFLQQKYFESSVPSQKNAIWKSLGCTTDEEVLNLFLEKVVNEGGIQLQDLHTILVSPLTIGAKRVDTILDFVTRNHQAIGSNDDLNQLIFNLTDRFTTQEQITKLRSFTKSEELDEEAKKALENAEVSVRTTKAIEEELRGYFHQF